MSAKDYQIGGSHYKNGLDDLLKAKHYLEFLIEEVRDDRHNDM